eukprot:592473-Prorocentrum_minimum.AAC.1
MQVEKFHVELDKLNGTLKQIEAYNEQMKNEIAVTRRATYVAEESVTNMEKEKKEQDFLIDNLQEQLKRLHQQHQLYEAQLVAQQRETRAAQVGRFVDFRFVFRFTDLCSDWLICVPIC